MLSKAEFMEQYILNRANTVSNLGGKGAAEEAKLAYITIFKTVNPQDCNYCPFNKKLTQTLSYCKFMERNKERKICQN